MSSEQDQVVATAPLAEARPAGDLRARAETLDSTPANRRRIVVAQKPPEKPIALISRDPELSEEFETQLGRARTVVVFPSLTHFCTDPSRMVWGGVVIARSCGWDARLLSFVPATSCIAFWGLAEEGYGWPASVRKLDTQEDITQWLEEIAKPLPFQLSKSEKRAGQAEKRAPTRRTKPKPQLKFELATARGVVTETRETKQETPLQMELNGLAEKRGEQAGTALTRQAATTRPSSRPQRVGSEQPPANAGASGSRTAVKPRAGRGAAAAQTSLDIVANTPPRRGRPPVSARAPEGALRPAVKPASQAETRAAKLRDEQALARASRAVAAKLIGTGRGWSAREESSFMKLAAELGLARAGALLDELRAHAHSLPR